MKNRQDQIKRFKKFLQENKHENFILFYDIETLKYNTKNAVDHPTYLKSIPYSVAVSYINRNGEIDKVVFKSFKEWFDNIFSVYKTISRSKQTITLTAHNGNRFDHFFLLRDIVYYYDLKRENMLMKNSLDKDNTMSVKEVTKEEKRDGIVLEKRVKTGSSLELMFYKYDIKFVTDDTLPKTGMGIDSLGKKLSDAGYIKKEEEKQKYKYDEFDLEIDMNYETAIAYAEYVFTKLSETHMTYIENDVIILASIYKYFNQIFPGFDYSKRTVTSNILKIYKDMSALCEFQLTQNIGRTTVDNIDYTFVNENYYLYLKSFYKGGLNFYNDKFLNKIIKRPCFSMDRNSSYPSEMYDRYCPTFLDSYCETPCVVNVSRETFKDYFTLYRMTKHEFNTTILFEIESVNIRKMLVKYYSGHEHVNITTATLTLLMDLCKIDIKTLNVESYVTYKCLPFAGREQIKRDYFVKTQGKIKNKIIMHTPSDIEILDILNDTVFNKEEVDASKVNLNGLYGIPALRAFFDEYRIFLNDQNKFEKKIIHNNFKNQQRNLIFSVFVTSYSLYDLLYPLTYLSNEEIDNYFYYADTDSLYLDMCVKHKIPSEIFDEYALGKWGYQEKENEVITDFFVLNHKKYCYNVRDTKKEEDYIIYKCAGIYKDVLDKNMSFYNFVETQFRPKTKIKCTRSVLNLEGVMCIYEGMTEMERGSIYREYFDLTEEERKKEMFERVKKEIENNQDGITDAMYVESNLGSFSISDIHPLDLKKTNQDLRILKLNHEKIKNIIMDLK